MKQPAVANGRPRSAKLTITGAGTNYVDFGLTPVNQVRVQASAGGDVLVYPSDISNPTVPALPTGSAGPITALTDGETRYLAANAEASMFPVSQLYRFWHFRVPGTVTLTINGVVMG